MMVENVDLKTILLLGDSYGVERLTKWHTGSSMVSKEETWPCVVKNKFREYNFIIDFQPFRRLVEIPDILKCYSDVDAVVIQAGIVDCYPRPLPLLLSKDMRLPLRLLRRGIRHVRRSWINYIYCTKWSSDTEIHVALQEIINWSDHKPVYLITVSPILQIHSLYTPGAQDAIIDFNILIRDMAQKSPNIHLIDLHSEFLKIDYSKFLSNIDSHLNLKGNNWLSDIVIKELSIRLNQGD